MTSVSDVRWNHADAEAASTALRRAASELDRSAAERNRNAQPARAEWRGQQREAFDANLRRLLNEAQALAEEYRAAAARIDGASARAREEQSRRERAREREQQRGA